MDAILIFTLIFNFNDNLAVFQQDFLVLLSSFSVHASVDRSLRMLQGVFFFIFMIACAWVGDNWETACLHQSCFQILVLSGHFPYFFMLFSI